MLIVHRHSWPAAYQQTWQPLYQAITSALVSEKREKKMADEGQLYSKNLSGLLRIFFSTIKSHHCSPFSIPFFLLTALFFVHLIFYIAWWLRNQLLFSVLESFYSVFIYRHCRSLSHSLKALGWRSPTLHKTAGADVAWKQSGSFDED